MSFSVVAAKPQSPAKLLPSPQSRLIAFMMLFCLCCLHTSDVEGLVRVESKELLS